jgi:hypothetical protein
VACGNAELCKQETGSARFGEFPELIESDCLTEEQSHFSASLYRFASDQLQWSPQPIREPDRSFDGMTTLMRRAARDEIG